MGANFIPDSTKQKQTTTKPTPDTYCKNPTKVFLLFLSFLLFQLNVVMIFMEERKVKTRRKRFQSRTNVFLFPILYFWFFLMKHHGHNETSFSRNKRTRNKTKTHKKWAAKRVGEEKKRKAKVMNYDSRVISDYSFSATARAFKTVFVSLFVSKSSLNCINS